MHQEPARRVDFVIEPNRTVRGDQRLLRIALENLRGNSWKFTQRKPHARIEFGTVMRDDQTFYFVRDDGVGFDMAYADKLFSAFQRLHEQHEFPGTGIGLATVQRVIDKHGGRIWGEGEVGKGATFYFTL
jgi:light-regulated signal transduction histidine kinase (bacteriophytochrome)